MVFKKTKKSKKQEAEEDEEEEEEAPEIKPKKSDDETESEIIVVNELPTQQVRTVVEDGKEYELITRDEALKEILETLRKLDEEE